MKEPDLYSIKKLAWSKGCFVVTKPGYWLLYREATPKNILVGKRSNLKSLLSLVKKY